MPNGRIVSAVLMLAALAASTLHAQTAPGPQATGQAIPDLSGIWEAPLERLHKTTNDVCGESACNTLQKVPSAFSLVITVEEPQMLPWAEEQYRASRMEGRDRPREEADPWFTACTPLGPSRLIISPLMAMELRQFPDMVLMFFGGTAGEADHLVRRVYVDGRGHPANWKPTWEGHSIGHYDGDTLVVDTVGLKGDRWLDQGGHPHSDQLHLVERIRRVDLKRLEVELTITDPVAYKNSWTVKIVRELALPGPRFWDEAECEELLQMGTHYGAEARGEN